MSAQPDKSTVTSAPSNDYRKAIGGKLKLKSTQTSSIKRSQTTAHQLHKSKPYARPDTALTQTVLGTVDRAARRLGDKLVNEQNDASQLATRRTTTTDGMDRATMIEREKQYAQSQVSERVALMKGGGEKEQSNSLQALSRQFIANGSVVEFQADSSSARLNQRLKHKADRYCK